MSSDVSSGEAVNDGGRSETLMLSQVITESATTMTTERVESGDIHNDARTGRMHARAQQKNNIGVTL